MDIPLSLIIVYILSIIAVLIFGFMDNPSESLNDEIVLYNAPSVTTAHNGTSVFVTGTIRDNSAYNFSNITLNVSGIGEHGQVVNSENLEIHYMGNKSNVNYNASLENDSTVLTGEIQVLNATISS